MIQARKNFLNFFADLWIDWIGEENYDTFLRFGSYSKKHLDTNLRIISPNFLFCDAMNFYLLKNPTDPSNHIIWLESELKKAEINNEVVYLIGHISAGDTSLLSECAKRYKALIDRFSDIIVGQFSGHTHFDEVKIINEYFTNKPQSIVFIAPSLTTHAYFNPSFRLFEIDSNSKMPIDYLQYRMNLTAANMDEINPPKWEISYKATEMFQVDSLNDVDQISSFIHSLKTDDDAYDRTCKAFFTDGPQYEANVNKTRTRNYLYCRMKHDIFDDFFDCIAEITWNEEDYIYKVMNMFSGKWYKLTAD